MHFDYRYLFELSLAERYWNRHKDIWSVEIFQL